MNYSIKPNIYIDFKRYSSELGIHVWFDYGIEGFDDILSILRASGGSWNKEYLTWFVKGEFAFYCIDLIKTVGKFNVLCGDFLTYYTNTILKKMERGVVASKRKKPMSKIEIPCPDGLSYFDFQKAAVEFFNNRNKSILLADDMGLGKTITAIAIANYNKYKKILVICPDSAKDRVWRNEIEKWYMYEKNICVVYSGKPYDNSANIVIINYDLISKYKEILISSKFTYLISDEAHMLKTPGSKRTKTFKAIANSINNKILLTGTPILNRPVELYSLVRILSGEFGNYVNYAFRYCNAKLVKLGESDKVYLDDKGYSNLSELNFKLRSTLMMRREKADVLEEFPNINRVVFNIDADYSIDIEKKYKEEKRRYTTELSEVKKKKREYFDYASYTKAIKKTHRYHFEKISLIRHDLGINKIPDIIAFINKIFDSDVNKVVLFLHHRDVIDAIKDAFVNESVVVYGGMNSREKAKAVNSFEEDKSIKLFIGSIQASGIAYTLTIAHTVVFGELDWTPSMVYQCEGRCVRLGQKFPVDIYYLIVNNSLDQNMMHKIDSKGRIIKSIMV